MHLFCMWFPLSWPRASVLRLVWTSMEDHSGVILPKITRFIPYAGYWKTPLASSLQLKFVCYHRSGSKNICQGVYKFGIISKWKNCVWDNGQDFGNLKKSPCQGMLFDTKTWPAIERLYLPQYFGNNFFLS